MSSVAGYIIAYSDDDYEGPSILPREDWTPRCMYRTVEGAEAALKEWIKDLDSFSPALYGEVYPFENTTARQEISKKGYAIYGWAKTVVDDEIVEEYGIYISEVKWE
jgi:hypothetical protein